MRYLVGPPTSLSGILWIPKEPSRALSFFVYRCIMELGSAKVHEPNPFHPDFGLGEQIMEECIWKSTERKSHVTK